MPPTDDEQNWEEALAPFLEFIRMPTSGSNNPAVNKLKQYCALLAAYGVDKLRADYNGEGDSGDLDVYVVTPRPPAIGNTVMSDPFRGAPATDVTPLRSFVQHKKQLPGMPFDSEKISEIEDSFYELLPGGWEINDGSFGTIVVNPSDGTVYMEHNERYSEVNTSEYNW
jgi:hypothetical protein